MVHKSILACLAVLGAGVVHSATARIPTRLETRI